MDNIKWSEWETAGKTFLYDDVQRRSSQQEFYVWRGDYAERISGTVTEWRCFINGNEVEGNRVTTAHSGNPESFALFGQYRSDAYEEHNVLAFTELECVDKVLALREKHMRQTAEKHRTAKRMYADALQHKEKLVEFLSLVDEPSSDGA